MASQMMSSNDNLWLQRLKSKYLSLHELVCFEWTSLSMLWAADCLRYLVPVFLLSLFFNRIKHIMAQELIGTSEIYSRKICCLETNSFLMKGALDKQLYKIIPEPRRVLTLTWYTYVPALWRERGCFHQRRRNPNEKMGVFWANFSKKHPIWAKLSAFCYRKW